MSTVTIYDIINEETICESMVFWGMADALVSYLCDNGTPQEVYDACIKCADAYAKGMPTEAYEAFLGISIEG